MHEPLDQYAEAFKLGRWDGYWKMPKMQPWFENEPFNEGYADGYKAGQEERDAE